MAAKKKKDAVKRNSKKGDTNGKPHAPVAPAAAPAAPLAAAQPIVLATVPPIALPPVPPGVADRRQRPLFAAHPLKDVYESTHRLPMAVQFHGYNVDGTGIVCLADLKEVSHYLAGAKLAPVRVNDRYAIVSLLLNKYYDSSVGPYDAIVASIFASQNDLVVPWFDATTLLLPQFDQTVALVLGPYAMSSNTRALDFGRDLMGVNKLEANARIDNFAGGTSASILDGSGAPLLDARVGDPTLREQALGGDSLALQIENRFGPEMLALLASGEPSQTPFIGYDPDSGLPLAVTRTFIKARPVFKPWSADDRLDLYPGIHVSDLLLRFRVRPVLTTRSREMEVVLEPGLPGAPSATNGAASVAVIHA